MESIKGLATLKEFVDKLSVDDAGAAKLGCIVFYASSHEMSKHMVTIAESMVEDFSTVKFAECDVGNAPSMVQGAPVNSLPQVWVVNRKSKVCLIEGMNPPAVAQALTSLSQAKPCEFAVNESLEDVFARIDKINKTRFEKLIKQHPIALCVSEVSQASSSLVESLKSKGVSDVEVFDTHKDLDIHYWCSTNVKMPALYADGVLRCESASASGLEALVPELLNVQKLGREQLNKTLKELTSKAEVVLFMKGTKDAPFCKFSKRVVNVLKSADIDFDYVNIFDDTNVREGMKTFSQWPTFPQLYVKGNFVGGCDIVEQMLEMAGGPEAFKTSLFA